MQTTTNEIVTKFGEFQETCKQLMPKADLALVIDILLRTQRQPNVKPLYTVEVFTNQRLDTEFVRQYIIGYTGMAPAAYDNGTHFVTNQRFDLDTLKMISDKDNVEKIKGYYSGEFASPGPARDIHDEVEEY